MSLPVVLTDGAARDLDELYASAYDRRGVQGANLFLDRIEVALERIAARPQSGEPLEELRRLGLRDDLQLRIDPHRIVYRVRGDEVLVVLIASLGRSLQSLLQRRMLDS